MSLISIRDVWKEYGEHVVLEQVSLEIEPRAFVALVGPSGCGKTTFLKMLLSEERPTRGIIEIEGAPIPTEPDAERGVVFQRYSVFPHLTVLGNVLLGRDFRAEGMGGRLFGRLFWNARRAAEAEARDLLAAVGLAGAEAKYPAQLSGGMQQRLALAQALIGKPKVLLLDEPFGALDPGIRAEIHELMQTLWHERALTVVMVTHDLSEAFSLATRVVAFERSLTECADGRHRGAGITRDLEVWPKRIAGEPRPRRKKFTLGRDDPSPQTQTGRDDPTNQGMVK